MARRPGKNALLFIFITVMLNMIGFGVIMPVMPDLIMSVTGQTIARAAQWGGLLTFVYAMAQFIMMPIVGGLSDRFGRRPIILASLAAYSFDFLIMAIAPVIGLIVAARLLAGAFAATFSTANAYIADISPPEKRAANFGLMGAAFGLGFVIGPGIGGILGDEFGPRAPFYFVAALGATNFIYGFFVLPETHKPENRRPFEWRRANAFSNFKQFAQYPVMLPIAGAILLYQLAHWTFPSVWSYFAIEKFGWSKKAIGWSLMYVGLMAAIVQGGLTRIIIPKIGERKAALTGVSIAIATYIAFAFANEEWMVYGLITISALAGLTLPSLQGIMSRTIPANAQGELQGAVAAISSLSMIIGPPLMTQIFAAFSAPDTPYAIGNVMVFAQGVGFYLPGAPFLLAALLTLFAFIPLMIAFRHVARPRAEAAAT